MGEHREFRVYDECEHDHSEGDPGTTTFDDIGTVCEEAYMHSVCEACHTNDGVAHEDTPEEQAWPCDAARYRGLIEEAIATGDLPPYIQDGMERALVGKGDKSG